MNLRSLIPIRRDRDVAPRGVTDPFAALQTEIAQLFDDFSRGWSRSWPAATARTQELVPSMDITESDKEFEITVELPGLQEKDVQVNVADGVLTVKGEKKAEKEEKNKNYHRYERSYGSFARALELPEGVDPDAIKANLANGVLRVTVPKPAPAQAKKIEVKAAA